MRLTSVCGPDTDTFAEWSVNFLRNFTSSVSPSEPVPSFDRTRSEEHTSELQSQSNLVCRLLLEKKKQKAIQTLTQFQLPSLNGVYLSVPTSCPDPPVAYISPAVALGTLSSCSPTDSSSSRSLD